MTEEKFIASSKKIITVSKERMDGKVINVLFNEYNTENFVKAKKNADWLFNLICEFHQNRANEYNPWTRFRGASSLLYAAIKDERKRFYSQYVIDKQDCKKYAVLTLPVREFFQFLYDEKLITGEKRDEYINTLYSIIPGNNVGGNIVQHKDTADSPQDINKITDAFLYIINQLYKGSHIPQKAQDAKIFWCETRNKDKIICIDNMEDLISLAGKVEGLANYTIMLNELSAESQSSGDLLKDIFYRLIDRGIAHHNKNRIKYRYLKKEYYAIKADELEKLFNNNSVKM